MQSIPDRRSLSKKLRVGSHLHLHVVDEEILDKLLHFVVCPHRHRGFYHHKAVLLNGFRYLTGNRGYIA